MLLHRREIWPIRQEVSPTAIFNAVRPDLKLSKHLLSREIQYQNLEIML
jgi:hypothetical protein